MELVILTQSQALDLLKEAYLQGRRESGDDSAMNVEQAAAFLGIGEGTLYARALNGEIPCKRIGKKYLLLRRYVTRTATDGKEPNQTRSKAASFPIWGSRVRASFSARLKTNGLSQPAQAIFCFR